MLSSSGTAQRVTVPFFRPLITDAEVAEVVDTLRSGWLTTGPKVRKFEADFAAAVGARDAIALNSCTAALHLALAALGLDAGQAVLVPTMTFAATAEVVRYSQAVPLLVDCEPDTLHLSLEDAASKMKAYEAGEFEHLGAIPNRMVGMVPVHIGGMMMDMNAVTSFSRQHDLWVVEDAAHSFPAAWRAEGGDAWIRCGEGTASVTCFSFYANKTITTGEGGIAVTNDPSLAERIRMLSLHGLSYDAWSRYSGSGSWDYKILAPGYKYNLTDIAAAIGLHQLERADEMRLAREEVAARYRNALSSVEEIDLPPESANRIHSWHLFPLRLKLEKLSVTRDEFIKELKEAGIGCSVHWRPLHLHPYYQQQFRWRPEDFPVATAVWRRLVSLPIFPGMRDEEVDYVIDTIKRICRRPLV